MSTVVLDFLIPAQKWCVPSYAIVPPKFRVASQGFWEGTHTLSLCRLSLRKALRSGLKGGRSNQETERETQAERKWRSKERSGGEVEASCKRKNSDQLPHMSERKDGDGLV